MTSSTASLKDETSQQLCNSHVQNAQGLQPEQQTAQTVEHAATQQAPEMPIILFNEHGQALIQPYLQMHQHYEVRRDDRAALFETCIMHSDTTPGVVLLKFEGGRTGTAVWAQEKVGSRRPRFFYSNVGCTILTILTIWS